MSHLSRLGSTVNVSLPRDEDGYIGRECPKCASYFKITPGTGVPGPAPRHCPYCGYEGDHNKFVTQEQVEYAKSIALQQVSGAVMKDLKAMEFTTRGPGRVSMKVHGRPLPVRYYREKTLETELICENCSLRYTIYGVFGFCPDCGAHNSFQMLIKNLDLVEKQVSLAGTVNGDLAVHLISDALENAVSAFDGFGREACRIHAKKTTAPQKAENLSFQNLHGARQRLQEFFGLDLASPASRTDWELILRCFQKRHLLAHKMGVIDEAYVKATSDPEAVIGRKVRILEEDVLTLTSLLRQIGLSLLQSLESCPDRGSGGTT